MTFGSTFGRTFSPSFQPKSQAAASAGAFVPTDISGCKLWLDYADTNSMFTDDGTTKVSASGDKIYRINDKSGNANHAYQTGTDTTRPTYLPNAQNGKSVGKFLRSAAQWNYWTSISTIRTVFWMFKEVEQWYFAFVLGDANAYDFHRPANWKDLFWWGEYTSTYVKNGTLRVNASAIDGLSTNVPASFSVCSLVTTGNVQANCFSKDRNNTVRHFDGQLGELIIYTTALTGDQVSQVETYLNNKWAIY